MSFLTSKLVRVLITVITDGAMIGAVVFKTGLVFTLCTGIVGLAAQLGFHGLASEIDPPADTAALK